MNTRIFLSGMVALTLALPVLADDDDGWSFWKKRSGHSTDVAPVNNTLYQDECGDCHFAYQPGLLPARSWDKIMNTLSDHFDDNAELGAQEQKQIGDYLVENAADRSNYKRSVKFARSIAANETPLRITKTRYFIRKHDEVPLSVRQGKGQVKSMASCDACHTNAKTGSYDEDEIKIPGMRRWDD